MLYSLKGLLSQKFTFDLRKPHHRLSFSCSCYLSESHHIVFETKLYRLIILILTCTFMGLLALQARSDQMSFDPRSQGMGGVGVTTADYLTAAFHNPALVASYQENDDIGLLFPFLGYRLNDKDEVIDSADQIVDNALRFRRNINVDTASRLADSLRSLQGDTAFVQLGLGASVALPNSFLSLNFFSQYTVDAFVIADLSSNDFNVQSLIDREGILESRVNTIGVSVTEWGVAIADRIDTQLGSLHLGVSPKIQRVESVNYIINVDNFDLSDWRDDQYIRDFTRFNFDVGFAFDFKNGVVVGLAGKNVIQHKFEFEEVLGVTGQYRINPVWTSGVSYQHPWFSIGFDIDWNSQKRFDDLRGTLTSIDPESDNTRLLGLGVEINTWNWAKLRAGFQSDMNQHLDKQLTFGAAFTPFELISMDLSGNYAGKSQYGYSLKLAILF